MAVATDSTFGDRLRQLREQAGISGYELAKRAGVPDGMIYQLEQGGRRPYWDTVLKLARALGVSVAEFDAGVADDAPEPARPTGKRK